MGSVIASAAWNFTANLASFSTDGKTPDSPPDAPAALTSQDPEIVPPVAAPLDYYVRFTLANGATLSVNGASLFALSSFSFSSQQALAIGNQSGGAGAGKVAFSPLKLSIPQLALQPALFQALTAGTALQSVDVLGYGHADGQLTTDYRFKLVSTDTLVVDSSATTQVSLLYGGETLLQGSQLPDGSEPTDPPLVLTPQDSAIAPPYMGPLDYYVRFTLSDGSSVNVNGADLFALTNFSFADQNVQDIGSQSSGAGAGKVTFSPLQLSLTQLALQPLVFAELASGTAFKRVDVLGYASGQLVTDYNFALATADKLVISAGATQIELQYGAGAILQGGLLPAGGPQDPPATLAPQSPEIAPPVTAPLDYYVRFNLDDGTSVAVNGASLFGLANFSFDDLNVQTTGGQTSGGGAGKLTFSPLTLSMPQLDLQPQLYEALTSGTAFQSVDVLGYASGQLTTDYSFKLVLPSDIAVNPSASSQVNLKFAGEQVLQGSQLPSGAGPTDPPLTLKPQDVAVAPPATGPLDYYVTFTRLNDDFVSVNGSGLFALSNFSFDQQVGLGSGSQSSGAGSGKITFSPLQLSIPQLDLQPELFRAVVSGNAYKSVDVYAGHRASGQLTAHYVFKLVGADALTIDASGATQVSLQYGGAVIQQNSQATSAAASPTPQDPAITPPDPTPLNYYVRFSLFGGATVTVNGADLFALSNFSFSDQNTLTIGSPSGGVGVSKFTFEPLQLSFSQFALQPALFRALASGTAFQSVDILGYASGQLTTDYNFKLAGPDALSVDSSGAAHVELKYGGQEILQGSQLAASGSNFPTTLTPQNPEFAASFPGPLDYYVRFTLYDGTTIAVNGADLFALSKFSFSDQQVSGFGSQTSGAGAGEATFTPLLLTFSQLALQPTLYHALTSGSLFKDVDVLGYSQGHRQLLADYSFGVVSTDNLAIDSSGATQVSLKFGSEQISAFDPGPTAGNAAIVVGHGRSVDETALVGSLISAGLPGDTETVTAVTGNAVLASGVITYTAPGSGPDSFGYTVQDQHGNTASGVVNVTVDPGPTAGSVTPVVQLGQTVDLTSLILNAATPGLPGDALSITADSVGHTLGLVTLANGDLTYAASAAAFPHIPANGSATDMFAYTITDQYGDVANGTVNVTVTNPAAVIHGPARGRGKIQGTAGADVINAHGYFNTIYDNGGNDLVNAGDGFATVYAGTGDVVVNLKGYFNAVSGGDGWDSVSGGAGYASVTLGNGDDVVRTSGYGNTIRLGDGKDKVIVGSSGDSTITLGNGDDAVTAAGYGNLIRLGNGNDVVVAGSGGDTVVAGSGDDTVSLSGWYNDVTLGAGDDVVNGGQGGDRIALSGGTAKLNLVGRGDHVVLNGGESAVIVDTGSALRVDIGASTGRDVITGFNGGPGDIVDLLNGAGGYGSVSQILNALHSDGHGGSLLSLGPTGSIDFAGLAPAQLHRSNFRIG